MMEVVQPGLMTTVQDLGRAGHAAEGFPECGACDQYLYALANILCGNRSAEAALECTLLGPRLRFHARAVIAITGQAHPLLNGQPVRTYFPLDVAQGDVLDVGQIDAMRAYLAVYGGITVPMVLGSRSTDLKCHIGGLNGRALVRGDRLPFEPVPDDAVFRRLKRCAARLRIPRGAAATQETVTIRVVPGPQEDAFTQEGIHTFYSSVYTVSGDTDRMGMKLTGSAIASHHGTDILSDGILEGSVQVSANGQPIIMLADHQTTGGYAKIATVIPCDLGLLAQLRPGACLRFERMDRSCAVRLYREEAAALTALMEGMNRHDDQCGYQLGSGRELRRVHHRHGCGGYPLRHIRQRRVRLSRG